MYKVKLTFPYPSWDLLRQTPDSLGVWGDFKFYINENIEDCDYWVVFNHLLSEEETVICSPKNTIFLTAEASSIQLYDHDFLNQFEYVISCQERIKHKHLTLFHQGHPWHVGRRQSSHKNESFTKSYSDLISMTPPEKRKKISIIASDVQLTEGHIKRYEFAKALKRHFQAELDWFGRGVNEISDKWDALIDYKYSVAIENFQEPDWVTEKIYDCYLAYTMPIYHGSPNIGKYFPETSLVKIDINDIDFSINQIEAVLKDDSHYTNSLNAIAEARTKYLNELNIFPLIVNFIRTNSIKSTNRKRKLILKNKVEKQNTKFPQKFIDLKQKIEFVRKNNGDVLSLLKVLTSKAISRVGNRLVGLSEAMSPPPKEEIIIAEKSVQAIRCEPWFEIDGDKTLRLEYDLNEDSIVFDLGGYQGQWASDIFSKYNCNLFIFEPYKLYSDKIINRFSHNQKIKVFPFGLGNESKSIELNVSADSSSLFKRGDEIATVALEKASTFFEEHNIKAIDLIKINIEGGEYDILDHLIETGFVKNIKNIQVQFHDFVPFAERRMKQIQEQLSKTHFTTYQYQFVWENWRLK